MNYYTYPADVDVKADPSRLFGSFYQRLVGGSGWHWQGLAPRMVPNDFVHASKFGDAIKAKYGSRDYYLTDWPAGCRYDDLEPWFSAAEQEMGVAGDTQAFSANFFGSHRSKAFPLPPIELAYQDRRYAAVLNGQKFHGLDVRVTPVPQAKNSEDHDGRPKCDGRSTCIPLCPTRSKYEAVFHLEKARRSREARVEVRERCFVTHLEVNRDKLLSRIHYTRWGGQPGSTSGRVVILAANGIESPMILLSSKSIIPDNTQRGVANSSGAVGKYLMDHPIRMSFAFTRDPVFAYRGPLVTGGIETMRDGAFRGERAAFRTSILNDGWSWPVGAPFGRNRKDIPNDMGSLYALVDRKNLFGEELRKALVYQLTRQTAMTSAAEMLPSASNYVVPSNSLAFVVPGTDGSITIPRPEIRYSVDDYAHEGLEFASEFHNFVYTRLGVASEKDIHIDQENKYYGSGHIMGTTIMGKVVDGDCRSLDHRNLFILGSSVFPTASTANPTLTLAALALRAGEKIKQELKRT